MIDNAGAGSGMGQPPTNPLSGGMPSPTQNVNPQVKSMLEKLANANGGEGVKEAAKTIFAILSRVTEFAIPLYGMGSPEGKELMKVVNSLNKLAGDKTTSANITSMIQSLVSILPSNMQKINPSNLTDLLTKGAGMGAGAGAPTLPPPSSAGMGAGAPMPAGLPAGL